ncbi:glycosyltransferase family 9 protein [Larkinella rosea]|uniref:Glycosyltransferase family 9 protein n=1 Tax=Larkinella rosea TaxID=2025312 RepID=A0A3P1BBF7_9BACT|nr:glycosyltransferase family 9 protein [Larkinella rosea]RRA97963.1 glycosyltransferase family 9 protein [Larkinella rosea]
MTNNSITLLEKHFGRVGCALLTWVRRVRGVVVKERRVDQPCRKIVFVKFIEQGALVLHQNTFREAADTYGAANVYLCTFAASAQLIDILNVVPRENRITINEKSLWLFTKGFVQALIRIRKQNIDTVIDLEFFSCATAIFCYLTGATKRAGYHRFKGAQNYRGDLFTHRLSYSHYVHVTASSWCLLKSLERPVASLPALDVPVSTRQTEISFTPNQQDLTRFRTLLGEDAENPAPILIVNPSLNDVLPLRKWPAENFAAFVKKFRERFPEHVLVFTGRGDEREKTDRFIHELGEPQAINLCGKTELRDILTLYSRARLLVTTDSGPAHFAAMTPVHTVVLFGPETPALYAPLSERTHVMYNALPCSPCYNVYNNRVSTCPRNLCMQTISVDQVMQTATKILEKEPEPVERSWSHSRE